MLKKISLFVCVLFSVLATSQELNCRVIVNSDQVEQTNQQVFRTLERSLNDFINKTRWTSRQVDPDKRIECSMLLTITDFENSSFTGTIQIQSNRPVFNSNYQSPVFNHQDKQFNFNYVEFQPLFFNPNVFDSNLSAVITYYVYIILGIDADTFAREGGTPFFQQAQNIVGLAQGSGYLGWQQTDGNRTRWELVDNLLSNTFREYRLGLYNYHRLGMDVLADSPLRAKKTMANSMNLFERLYGNRPNSFVLQTFFDAKSEEIASVFEDGPEMDTSDLVSILSKIAPLYSETWSRIN